MTLTEDRAIAAAAMKILRDHIAHCVADAFASGDRRDQRRKIEELMETIGRMSR